MKSILITGANSGFGYLTALTFARNGYKVYATTRSLKKDGVKSLTDIAKKEDLDIEWLVFDVTNTSEISNATKHIGQLDILVNNAGYGLVGPVAGFTESDFLLQLDTNLIGIHRMIRVFLPIMKSQGYGKIINIGSIAGKVTFPYYGLYSASKYGVGAYTEALRAEVRSFGIDVCLVEPGTFKTGFSNRIVEGEKDIVNGYKHISSRIDGMKKYMNSLGFLQFKSNPQKVADMVLKISKQRVSMLHNYVGGDSIILAIIRKLVPDNIWDLIVQLIVR